LEDPIKDGLGARSFGVVGNDFQVEHSPDYKPLPDVAALEK